MSKVEFTSHIEGETKVNTIKWRIPNFLSLLDIKTTREVRTQSVAQLAIVPESYFQLKIQFWGRNTDIIEIYYLPIKSLFLKGNLTVNPSGISMGERCLAYSEYHTVEAYKWQYFCTILKTDIESKPRNYLFDNGTLLLKFQFMINKDIKVDRTIVPAPQLCDDFENLLNDGQFSDVTITSAEGMEYKVHKVILASRSPVLKAHFKHNTSECITNIVTSPLESDVLKEVLTFIYSDKAPRVDEMPEKLLAAADYYQLCRLKSLSEEALHKKLTVENSIETLQLADLHSSNTLTELTLEFIKDGQAKHITKTEGWAKLKSVELIKKIYEYMMTDDCVSDISQSLT